MQIQIRTVWRLALAASLAVLFFGVWFQVSLARHWTRPASLPYGMHNPVLAVQMAKAPWPVEILLPGDNRAEMERQQYIDFGYIPSYTLLFLAIAGLQWSSGPRWVSLLAPVCVVLILVAAAHDVAENIAILRAVESSSDAAWAAIRPHAIVKWACAFLVILMQVPFYLTVQAGGAARVPAWILAVAALAAGVTGFISCVTGYERGIGTAALPLLAAMLVMPVFLYLGSRTAGHALQ